MILPEPRRDAVHQRGKAFLSTLLLAGLCYAGLLFASFSMEKPSRRIYREVDLASFAPPPAIPDMPEAVSQDPDAPETDRSVAEPVLKEAKMQSLDQLDLSQLFPDELTVELDPASSPETARNVQDNNEEKQIEVQSGGLQGLGSLDGLEDLGGAPVPASRGRTGRQTQTGNAGGIQIADGSGAVAPAQNPSAAAGGARVVGENTRRAATAEAADFDVKRLSLDAFGNDYENLEVQELIDWMKKNPGDLPVGVRTLVRHRDQFLTSATSFSLDGKRYELFLMCKEGLYEVHIVLVDVDDATYLIDRSFQKLSTYLREGQVARTADKGITAIKSTRTAASDKRSREFYALFLSWWDTAKQEG